MHVDDWWGRGKAKVKGVGRKAEEIGPFCEASVADLVCGEAWPQLVTAVEIEPREYR